MSERFGRFWLHEKIGHGGMAEVFRATVGPDPQTFSFELVIKRLHAKLLGDRRQRDMFLTESYLAKLMVHPNIIRAYESGDVAGRPYIAMEYVRGLELARLAEAQAKRELHMPVALALFVAQRVLRALEYIHQARAPGGKAMGIIHRDITPSNIFLNQQGKVKVGDFGVARVNLLEAREDAQMLKGKVAYTPPEVILGAPVTQQLDLWSLGVCLFEMLAGQRLFQGMSEKEIIVAADSYTAPSADSFSRSDVAAPVVELIGCFLHPDPRQRPASASAALKLLLACARTAGLAADDAALAAFLASISERAAGLDMGKKTAERDPLTGVYSNLRTLELLQVELERSRRYGRVFSVLCMDVDNFYSVNERFGAQLGDDLLRYMTSKLLFELVTLRSSDFVGRRAGNRFLLVLPETPAEGAHIMAERVREHFAKAPWTTFQPGLTQPITVSLGVATYPVHGETVGALVEASEVCCYHAKLEGKNCVLMATSEFKELKGRVASGAATAEDMARWEELSRHYREIRVQQGGESRRYKRTEISLDVVVFGLRTTARAVAEDLSAGGLRLNLPIPIDVGEEVSLELIFPDEEEGVPATARVVWRRKEGVVGLEFLELPPHARERIEALF